MNLSITNVFACAVFVFATGSAIAAAPVLPKGMPPYAEDRALPVPQIAKKTLENGLIVWVIPRNAGNPKVDMVLAVRGGQAADDEKLSGLSSLMAGLLEEGTRTRSSVRIAEELQSLGATLGASSNLDGILVKAAGLASNVEPLMRLLADVALNAIFPDAEIALAKTNALEALKVEQAEPGYQAAVAMDRVVYGSHPYGQTHATERSIKAIDRNTLVATHKSRFRPDRALLVISGRLDAARGFALAEKAFGAWKATGKPLGDTPKTVSKLPVQRVFVERADSVQSTVRLGRPAFAAGHDDEIAAEIANAIAGGDFSSRLSQVLREEKGYTYGAYSAFDANRVGGSFVAGADVRNEVTGSALGEFQSQFQKLIDTPVDANELQRFKRMTAGHYLFRNQLQAAVVMTLANNWLLGRAPEYLGEFIGRTNQVTAEQVQAVAKKYFDPKELSVVVVGEKSVAEQLKPYGEFSSKAE